MTPYAQIPSSLICRFGELTKTEIVVICYLYTTRNRKSGQCNPSRSAIARAVNIDRAHVSPAVKNLERKGWLIEQEDGNFHLINEPAVVTKSAQGNVTEIAQCTDSAQCEISNKGVRNPQQGCAESVTRNNRISSEQKKEQKKEPEKTAKPSQPSDHQRLFAHHSNRIGIITDGAAQGKAIKSLLKNFSVDDCLRCYDYQTRDLRSAGGWRDAVNWNSVLKGISEWITGGRPLEPKRNGSNKNTTEISSNGIREPIDVGARNVTRV
jgi:DNA-binding MarR family transcriptional regulator